jgi:hypothetical protein
VIETDLFGLPVGKQETHLEWSVRWERGRIPGAQPPGHRQVCADEEHARAVAKVPDGARWDPGTVLRREVVTITGPWEKA